MRITMKRVGRTCFYALDSRTEALVVEDSGYRVKLGPALAEQLRAALGGLCEGTGRVRDRNEFLTLMRNDAGVLFEVSASATMDAKILPWAVNTGSLRGQARVTGPSELPPLRYGFAGSGEKRQYYAEMGSGAEGLRRALGEAIQNLIDQARRNGALLERLGKHPASESNQTP